MSIIYKACAISLLPSGSEATRGSDPQQVKGSAHQEKGDLSGDANLSKVNTKYLLRMSQSQQARDTATNSLVYTPVCLILFVATVVIASS